MPFFFAKQPKPKGYRSLYREELKTQKAADLKKKVREDVRRDLTPKRERIAKQTREDLGSIDKTKSKFYKNIGGTITIHKDALKRLKNLGKR